MSDTASKRIDFHPLSLFASTSGSSEKNVVSQWVRELVTYRVATHLKIYATREKLKGLTIQKNARLIKKLKLILWVKTSWFSFFNCKKNLS